MKKVMLLTALSMTGFAFTSYSQQLIKFSDENLKVVNREIFAIDEEANTLALNDQSGSGMAIIEHVNFDIGTIEIELKGENIDGKSFVGVAFNIENDSTYEAVYFRPFNFQSDEKLRRGHSVQYIYHPKNTWRFLRTNYEGQYEAEFPRQPSPDDWFRIRVKVDTDKVYVYDGESNIELLAVDRLSKPSSRKIGLWTGHNSKGEFRNLKINVK